jgi:hypothetical protein
MVFHEKAGACTFAASNLKQQAITKQYNNNKLASNEKNSL